MRGLLLVFTICLSLVGCEQINTLPAVPITLTLKADYKTLHAGANSLMLGMSDNGNLGLFIYTPDLGVEVFSISRETLSIDTSYPTLDRTLYQVQGVSADGIEIKGKLISSPGIACEKANEFAHRACRDVREYHFKADLLRGGETIGSLVGEASKDQ
jgi:hypothetical protein